MSIARNRRRLIVQATAFTLGAWSIRPAPAVGADWLVTPDEVERFGGRPDDPVWFTRTAGAPVIEVVKPADESTPLTSPLPIELRFRAATDAAIDVASFRVFYGAFKLDITQRLLKSVAIRADGIRVDEASIPTGNHRLVLQIADNRERVGWRELRFAVR